MPFPGIPALVVFLLCGVEGQRPGNEVLQAWIESLGGPDALRNATTIHMTGRVATGGLTGTYERWVTANGELRTDVILAGTFRKTIVFNGHQGWSSDGHGALPLSGEVLESVITSAYEGSYSFFFPGRMPGQVSLQGVDAVSGKNIIRIEPEGGRAMRIYLDRDTHLPVKEVTSGSMGERIVAFSDWREVANVRFPGHIRQSGGGTKFDLDVSIDRVEVNSLAPPGIFTEPANAGPVIAVENRSAGAMVTAEVFGDHILIPVRLNGSRLAWFFLDTGAGLSVVSKSLARDAGLPFKGELRGQGTGTASAGLGLAQNATLQFGEVRAVPSAVAVWDFSKLLPLLGRSWDGLIGNDVLGQVVVRLDYEKHQATFFDPDEFVPENDAAMLPVTFLGSLPVVKAAIAMPGHDPIPIACAIDSGADGLHLTTPFTQANGVMESIRKRIASSATGVGGSSDTFKGKAAALQLGPYTLQQPVVSFSPNERHGLLASPDIGALVGGEILKRFIITFDLSHRRIFLKANDHFHHPFEANESGMTVRARGRDFNEFIIDGIEPGSPAARAGLRPGDRVTEIDHWPAERLNLERIDELLRPSRTVPLTVTRKGKSRHVTLQLIERM